MGVLKTEKFVKCEITFPLCGLEDGKPPHKLKREVYRSELTKDKPHSVAMTFHMFSKVIFLLDEDNIFGITNRGADTARE